MDLHTPPHYSSNKKRHARILMVVGFISFSISTRLKLWLFASGEGRRGLAYSSAMVDSIARHIGLCQAPSIALTQENNGCLLWLVNELANDEAKHPHHIAVLAIPRFAHYS